MIVNSCTMKKLKNVTNSQDDSVSTTQRSNVLHNSLEHTLSESSPLKLWVMTHSTRLPACHQDVHLLPHQISYELKIPWLWNSMIVLWLRFVTLKFQRRTLCAVYLQDGIFWTHCFQALRICRHLMQWVLPLFVFVTLNRWYLSRSPFKWAKQEYFRYFITLFTLCLQTEAPSQFDSKLPPITGEDVEFLREQVPELSSNLKYVRFVILGCENKTIVYCACNFLIYSLLRNGI